MPTYLEALTLRLAEGIAALSDDFRSVQSRYVLAAQRELSMRGNQIAIATEGNPSSERGRFGDYPVKSLPHAR